MHRYVTIVTALLILTGAASLHADVVKLRTGELLIGTITAQTGESVTVESGGKRRTIPKTQIQRIVFGRAEEFLAQEQLNLKRQSEAEEARRRLAEKSRKDAARSQRFNALWKSALLPGSGSWARGSRIEGAALGSATGLTLLYSWDLRRRALREKRAYDRTSLASKAILAAGVSPLPFALDLEARRPYSSAVQRYNRSLNLLALVYTGQVLLGALGPDPLQLSSQEPGLHFALRFALRD